jgi:protein gp37
LLLTKRPENFDYRLAGVRQSKWIVALEDWIVKWQTGNPPPNVWIGVSVEDQQRADERIPELLKIPAAIRFLSAEPLLGPIDFRFPKPLKFTEAKDGIDWVIFGCESGPGARPGNVEWIRDGLRQCQAAHVEAFIKQLGRLPYEGASPHSSGPNAIKCNLYQLDDKKGGNPSEWPADLRVRRFPEWE